MSRADEIDALLFDVGQVILGVDIQRAAQMLAASAGISPEEVIASIEADPVMRSFQEGRVRPEQWHQHLGEKLGLRLSFGEFCRAWNSALEGEPLLGREFFSRLNPRLRLALLSNTDPIHVKHFESQFEIFSLFPVRLYSCELGLRKPSPGIYQRAIAASGAAAGRVLYVDDVKEFVEAGKRAGLQGYHHQRSAELIAYLSKRGLWS